MPKILSLRGPFEIFDSVICGVAVYVIHIEAGRRFPEKSRSNQTVCKLMCFVAQMHSDVAKALGFCLQHTTRFFISNAAQCAGFVLGLARNSFPNFFSQSVLLVFW